MAKKEILNNDAVTVRVGETAADILEETGSVIEETLDIIENTADKVITITKNNPFFIAGALLVGFGVGALVAYKLTQKKLTAEFDAELTEQIEATKVFYSRSAKTGDFETPESAVQALVPEEVAELVSSYQGREAKVPYNKPEEIVELVDPRPPVEVVVEEVTVTKNVFVENRDDPRDWDYNLEIADREANPDQPYVISYEEFHENPNGNEQSSLSYYEEDDVLADERDQPVESTDYTVGDDNLQRFGHGSRDRHVVFVRNEKLGMDFEITRSSGSYQMEVLGHEPELKHSQRRPNRRSWRADE